MGGQTAQGQSAESIAALNAQAASLKIQGKYAEAAEIAKRSLALTEKRFGPNHPSVGSALHNLADLHRLQGRYVDAEPLMQRNLVLQEKKHGPHHPKLCVSINSLAEASEKLRRLAEAERLYQRCIAILEKAHTPNHPDLTAALDNLAGFYEANGRYLEAGTLYKRVLALIEGTRGPNHLDLGNALHNLASVYESQGQYADAEALNKRALVIREAALGLNHVDVAKSFNNLAALYYAQQRYKDAEPLYRRAIDIVEAAYGPKHPILGTSLDNLAALYLSVGRPAEAEPLFKRALEILESSRGAVDADVGISHSNLATYYLSQGRHADSEIHYKIASGIFEKLYGADHPNVAVPINNLASVYANQGRFADAEALYQKALSIVERAYGPHHPNVAASLGNIAELHRAQSNWGRAAEFWRRRVAIIIHRMEQGIDGGGDTLTGRQVLGSTKHSTTFTGFSKVAYRLATGAPATDTALTDEAFRMAQWAAISDAAQSLVQMSARSAKNDSALSAHVRERQDLIAEWKRLDAVRTQAISQESHKRNQTIEASNDARLATISNALRVLDKKLESAFPDYAAFTLPRPLSIEEVQALLGPDEVLVLFLTTPAQRPMPAETFLWVVAKTQMRWVRSDVGASILDNTVLALRCGLDRDTNWSWAASDGRWHAKNEICKELAPDGLAADAPLPFDLAVAHELYKRLFGKVEDLIEGRHLLIVPSGLLNALPFHVLVSGMSNGPISGSREREAALLGASLADVPNDRRKQLKLPESRGILIADLTSAGPAEKAGLRIDDILVSLGGVDVLSVDHALGVIRARSPDTPVDVVVLRDSLQVALTVTLGKTLIEEWVPRMLDASAGDVQWLGTRNALTVLPAVSSLRALRQHAKESRAPEAYIGFGNPLLTGPEGTDKRAWGRQQCPERSFKEKLRVVLNGLSPKLSSLLRAGLADVDELRRQSPLPETADELCAVARSRGIDKPDNVVNLGERASEARVKALSADGTLSRARVVHFATHGLMASETATLTKDRVEPSLMLTPPAMASEQDDGLLMASEIAALKLDADWVILSACNTAAADNEGGDALSGLARAFFYAGARAVLVSHWYVDSEATVSLITKSFGALQATPSIGRAEAMRRAMTALVAEGGLSAHPSAWAPFVVVGEGAATK